MPKKIDVPSSKLNLAYYDHSKNWRRIRKHLNAPDIQEQMVKDMNKFTWGRWRRKFTAPMLPCQVDPCDWRHRKSPPAYWKYVCWSACHWLVNFNLLLAQRVEPDRPWQILTSPDHSTVWDGAHTLFDFNYCALGVSAEEAYELATQHPEAAILDPANCGRSTAPNITARRGEDLI